MKSIIQKNPHHCFMCGSHRWLEWHHIWGGALRDKSDRLGLVVRLCRYCHNEPPNGVHQNRERRQKLQAFAQEKAMEHYGWDVERFIKEFYKNYL
jgi:hypothetical protein